MSILKLVLSIATVALLAYLVYIEKKQPAMGDALEVIARYCMKHACDDCKFQKNEYCVLSDPPCDWRRKLRGEDE